MNLMTETSKLNSEVGNASSNLDNDPRWDASRVIRAPRGSEKACKSWLTEAAYRMIQNNLDPEVAENPKHLVVYGGIGRAARNWECFDQILDSLKNLNDDETLLIQSGKKTRRGCCLPTPTSCRNGRTGSISANSTARACSCTAR